MDMDVCKYMHLQESGPVSRHLIIHKYNCALPDTFNEGWPELGTCLKMLPRSHGNCPTNDHFCDMLTIVDEKPETWVLSAYAPQQFSSK